MQRILNENEELEIRIAELEKELDGLLQKSLTEKKPKKGFLSGKGQNKGPVGATSVRMYKKTKEVFNTFLAGKSDSGERGMALLRKLNKPEKYHIDCMDSYGETILMKAVRKNNRDLVDFLLVQGANIIHQDLEGETPLMVSAKSGNMSMTDLLLDRMVAQHKLKKGINKVMKSSRKTALMQAAERGHTKICILLVAHNAKFNMIDINGKNAQELATSNKHPVTARVFKKANELDAAVAAKTLQRKKAREAAKKAADEDSDSDAEIIDTDDEEEAEEGEDEELSWKERKLELEKLVEGDGTEQSTLLDDDIEGDYMDLDSPRTKARRMSYGDDEKMRDVRERNEALKAEVKRFEFEIQDLKEKQNPDAWSKMQALPVEERAQMLQKDDRSSRKKREQEEFHALILENQWEKAEQKFLLPKNVKIGVDEEDSFGETALMKAAQAGHLDSVEILIQYNANVDCRDKAGDTALMKAAMHNRLEVAEVLLDNNAVLNHHTKHKRHTALHAAAMRGHKDMVQLLVSRGANVFATDVDGNRPIHLALDDDTKGVLEEAEEEVQQSRKSTDPRVFT